MEARATCDSPLRFHAIAGATYRIAVDAAPSSGAIRLTLAPVPVDGQGRATILNGIEDL